MASPATEDGRKAGNGVTAKLNGLAGSEPEWVASRASTPKSTPSHLISKNAVRNGVSKPSSRAATPKSTLSERTSKSAARNGISRANSLGSRQSTPKSQPAPAAHSSMSSVAQPSSDTQSSAKAPPLMTRSASKGKTPLNDALNRWERSLYTPLIDLLDEWNASSEDTSFETGSVNSSHVDTSNNTPEPSIKTLGQSTPVPVNRRFKRGYRNRRRQTANTSTSTPNIKSTDSPAVTETQENPSQATEMADEASMLHSEDYPTDGDSEIYTPRGFIGSFSGNMDGPSSPTSNATGGTRASGRVRKPTAKALEAMAQPKRTRKPRAPKNVAAAGPSSGEAKSADQRPASINGRRLFDLAAAAVAPNFTPPADAESIVKALRDKYEAEKEKENKKPTEPEENGHASEQEEYFVVPPGHELYRPTNTYGDSQLPQPPMRLRSLEQAEKDRVFGYPPRMGERNLPRDPDAPFVIEDVDSVLAKIRAQEAARQNGGTTGHLILPKTEVAAQHGNAGPGHHAPLKLKINHLASQQAAAASPGPEPPRRRRRRAAAAPAETADEVDDEVDEKPEPKRRRRVAPASLAPASSESPRKRGRHAAYEDAENEEEEIVEPKRRRRGVGKGAEKEEEEEAAKPKKRRRTVGVAAVKEEEDEPKPEPKKRRRTEGPVEEEETPSKMPRLRLVFAKSKKQV